MARMQAVPDVHDGLDPVRRRVLSQLGHKLVRSSKVAGDEEG